MILEGVLRVFEVLKSFAGCLKKIENEIRASLLGPFSGLCTPDKITGNQW